VTIVDVHCHGFNADDIPVKGFVLRVLFRNHPALSLVADALDRLGQGMAPGFDQEDPVLSQMLAGPVGPLPRGIVPRAMVASPSPEDVEAEAASLLRTLEATNPDAVAAARQGGAAPPPGAARALGVVQEADAALLALKWVVLIGKARWQIASLLMQTYAEVELFVPMLVDLEPGVHDVAPTTIRQQMQLHEKVSRLSMLGLLPDGQAKIHPFIGFDPRRELVNRKRKDVKGALDLVKEAVTDFGFIGVKLYPPMGFRPLGNTATKEMSASDAVAVDAILRDLYTWCVDEDVPITTHCNPTNWSDKAYTDFSQPSNWELVLKAFPTLRLNLGHFGGLQKKAVPPGWPQAIAALVHQDPNRNLYVDTGNHDTTHKTGRTRDLTAYLGILKVMFADAKLTPIETRFMFGTDWYMNALHPGYEGFLADYRKAYAAVFTAAETDRFMGGAALEFLGFTQAKNKNTKRLVARYKRFRAPIPSWLPQK
jgi:predicted TIM-barrel fold metal-dependent hydrolase